MMKADLYSRMVSGEEAKEGYIFVLRDQLAFFPAVGRPFEVQAGARIRPAKVESYRCECRGKENPHEHYFIRWKDLNKGERIILRKDTRKAGRYVLQVRSTAAQHEFCG